ncbi:hypothetical protein cypCar_00045934, partial [Cyprinus carpio]
LDEVPEPCMGPRGYSRGIGTNQALNSDYENSGYDKGHLYPVLHTYDHLSMLATSTLTNAAPQDSDFNQKAWLDHERAVITDLQSCVGAAYVVTGVVPDMQAPKLNNRVYVSNTTWKIPVYSAYVFRKSKSIGRCDTWYIEPQLEDSRDSGDSEQCMGPQGSAVKTSSNQALNSDYKDSNNYHKGHLYPVLHTDNHLSMLATSTLTNAAPQDSDFNTNEWLEHERVVINNLQSCDKAYVVTGVVPDMQAPKLNNRVYVSKYYWRATCCLKNNQYTGQGYYGLDNNNQVKKLTIKDLQDFLKNVYQITFFPSVPTSNTEAKKPRIDKACN